MTPFEPFERSAPMGQKIDMPRARFAIGDVVRHRLFDFRGVIFDVDPVFANSEEWYEFDPRGGAPVEGPALLPSARRKCGEQLCRLCQPAEPAFPTTATSRSTIPAIATMFDGLEDGRYHLRAEHRH